MAKGNRIFNGILSSMSQLNFQEGSIQLNISYPIGSNFQDRNPRIQADHILHQGNQ